jgi:hypothetical protein
MTEEGAWDRKSQIWREKPDLRGEAASERESATPFRVTTKAQCKALAWDCHGCNLLQLVPHAQPGTRSQESIMRRKGGHPKWIGEKGLDRRLFHCSFKSGRRSANRSTELSAGSCVAHLHQSAPLPWPKMANVTKPARSPFPKR